MNGFAERLVARAAGTPLGPGIALLTPRPAARFEPSPLREIEAEAVAARPVAPVGNLASPAEAPPAPPAGRRGETPEPPRPAETVGRAPSTGAEERRDAPAHEEPPAIRTETPRMLNDTADRPSARSFSRSIERGGFIDRTGALATPVHIVEPTRSDPRPARRDELRRHEDRAIEHRPPLDQTLERPATPIDRRIGRPRDRSPVAVDEPKERESPPAPAISIGKIEVQFLPREPRLASPPPPPPRTRGFDAYARARRGERR